MLSWITAMESLYTLKIDKMMTKTDRIGTSDVKVKTSLRQECDGSEVCVMCTYVSVHNASATMIYLLLCDFCWIKYGVEVGSVCSVIDRKLLRLHIYFTVCSISVFRPGFCMCSGVCVHICLSFKSHHHHQVRIPKFNMRTQHIDVCNAMRCDMLVCRHTHTHTHIKSKSIEACQSFRIALTCIIL